MEQMDDATKDPAPLSQRIPRIRDRSRHIKLVGRCWIYLELMFTLIGHETQSRIAPILL